MRRYGAVVAIVATSLCLVGAPARADEEMVLCPLGVPRNIKSGYASFYVAYAIDVDATGTVTKATDLKSYFVSGAQTAACLKRWRFSGPARRLTVAFRWEHGDGWTSVLITDRGVRRTIRFEPGWAAESF